MKSIFYFVFLLFSACDPCWDKRENKQVLECLNSYPSEDILQYPKVASYLREHRIYISLTTSPKRISELVWVLKSLDLSYVDTIFLALPEKYKNKELYSIPIEFQNFPKLKIIRRSEDWGPIMKLLPAAEEVQAMGDWEARVITIDDDTMYPPGMIGQLIKFSVMKDAVIGGSVILASRFGLREYWPVQRASPPAGEIVEGFFGAIYPVKYIDVSRMIDLSKRGLGNVCKTSDDIVISWSLAEKQVRSFQIRNQYFPGVTQLKYGFLGDALHQGSGCQGGSCEVHRRYQACARELASEKRF